MYQHRKVSEHLYLCDLTQIPTKVLLKWRAKSYRFPDPQWHIRFENRYAHSPYNGGALIAKIKAELALRKAK